MAVWDGKKAGKARDMFVTLFSGRESKARE